MSLVLTESFMSFGNYTAGDTLLTADQNARNAAAANFNQWGYQATQLSNNYGPVVRQDPLYPTRKMLSQSHGNQTIANTIVAAIMLEVPCAEAPFIMGFNFWVPNEFIPMAAAVGNPNIFSVTLGGIELFRINADLTIRPPTGTAAQSSRKLNVNKANYVEFRYNGTEVRVWLDDILVLQVNVKAPMGRVALNFLSTNIALDTAGSVVSTNGRFGINHLYALLEDAVAPNVRLGPTTRVLGTRPGTDVQAQWNKPSGAASNAAVVGADVTANPTVTLQTETVGSTDFYTGTADGGLAGATLVHAVAVKAQAQNLDTVRHSLKVLSRVGLSEGEGSNADAFSLRRISSFTNNDLWAACMLASGGIAIGAPNDRVYTASDPVDLGTYAVSTEAPASTNVIRGMARNAAGKVVAVSDTNVLYGTESGSAVPAWLTVAHGATTGKTIIVDPADGSFYMLGTGSAIVRRSTDGGASWATVNIGTGFTGTLMRSINTRGGLFVATSWYQPSSQVIVGKSAAGTSGWTAVILTSLAGGSDPSVYSYPSVVGNSGVVVVALDVTAAGVIRFYRSGDSAATWQLATGTGPAVAMSATCGTFVDDSGTSGGYFAIGMSNGAIMVSRDGNNWTTLQMNATFAVRAIIPLPAQKGFLAIGSAGNMQVFTGQIVDMAMAPLGSYVKNTQFMTLNPQTGLPWTGAQAAAAEFGMRLTK